MDSEAYWAKRSEEREAAWQLKSRETLEKELAAYYEASLDHIQRNIDALYGRFAKDNALPMEEARKLLTGKEYRTWRMSLEEYVAQIDAGDKMLERELNTLAMRSRISRLDKLYSETLMELDGLGRKMRDRMDGFLGDAYKDNYYRGLYEIGHVGKTLPAIPRSTVNPWRQCCGLRGPVKTIPPGSGRTRSSWRRLSRTKLSLPCIGAKTSGRSPGAWLKKWAWV